MTRYPYASLRLGVRIVFESVDHAGDAVFDQRHVKVDEQAKTLVSQPEIGEKLLLVDRGEHLDGFDLGAATLEPRVRLAE